MPQDELGLNIKFVLINILGSSSIWMCQILNMYRIFVVVFCRQAQWKKKKNRYSEFNKSKAMSIKVWIFWEGHKNLAHLPLVIWCYVLGQIKSGGWVEFIWPSQNIRTLQDSTYTMQCERGQSNFEFPIFNGMKNSEIFCTNINSVTVNSWLLPKF